MAEIAPLDNRPWVPRPIPKWLIKELTRRKNDFGIHYAKSNTAESWNDTGEWNQYKGPMTPWVRVCSNGNGQSAFLKPIIGKTSVEADGGFILYGGRGFKDSFGIADNKTIMGYDAYGNPHYVPTEGSGIDYKINVGGDNRTVQPFLPAPGIQSIEATIQKELIRNVTIKWHCYGFSQLEYMTPYFLTPGISMIVEFGWNHFNQDSLLDLRLGKQYAKKYSVLDSKGKEQPYVYTVTSASQVISSTDQLSLIELWNDGTPLYDSNIRLSRGMYDVTFGLITNFEFNTTDGIKWECTTTIGSKHRNFSGVSLNNSSTQESSDGKGGNTKSKTTTQTMTFPQFLEKRLKKIKTCLKNNLNFFDNLDDTEKSLFKNVNLKNEFYNGYAENRVFFGRESNIDTTSNSDIGKDSWISKQEEDDWDYKESEKVWVTMGFLMEVFNFFFTRSSGIKDSTGNIFQFYKINTSGNIIGAHPNLISTNGDICLIPNAKAPKYNNGGFYKNTEKFTDASGKERLRVGKERVNDKYDTQYLNENAKIYSHAFKTKSSNSTASDISLTETFRTIDLSGREGAVRDDLDRILNRFLYYPRTASTSTSTSTSLIGRTNSSVGVYNPSFGVYNPIPIQQYQSTSPIVASFPDPIDPGNNSFPQYDQDDSITGAKKGHYGYLEDLFISADFIIDTAKQCKSTGEFYDKLLNGLNDSVNGFWDLKIVEDNKNLQIIDQKFISLSSLNEDLGVYQFDLASGNNIVKNLTFTSTVSNIQANQAIAASSNNQGIGENSTSQPLNFVFGDRLKTDKIKSNKYSISNSDTIKQLQTSGPNQKTFTMSFRIPGSSNDKLNVVNLTLPDKSLLAAILNDSDYVNNSNVYGGQQPNFTLEFTLQGISGFRTFQCISFKNFPRPYSDKDVIFQIVDVTHTVSNSNWETRIKAGIRPLRDYEKIKIKYTDGSNL